MIVPPQGFRHAVALFVDKGTREIPAHASGEEVADALERLARHLLALAHDMRAGADYEGWIIAEYERATARMPQPFDRAAVVARAAAILADCRTGQAIEPRDLFLVYMSEDRLPIAAPLAVELVKRRISVAFSDYEVATKEQLSAALEHGLAHHGAGAILWSQAFERSRWDVSITDGNRLLIVRGTELAAAVAALTALARRHRAHNTAK
jgi:hypothetical protein